MPSLRTHLLALLMLSSAMAIGGCYAPAVPEFRLPAAVRVEHFQLNRCSGAQARVCKSDRDCPKGECVSVLPSSAGAFGRDGGHTIAVGDRVLWLFGDSFSPVGMLSTTAGWSDAHDPLTLRDVVDQRNAVSQFLPFTNEEEGFNRDHRKPPSCCHERKQCPSSNLYCHCPPATDCSARVALWPGDGFSSDDSRATFYYEKYTIGVAPYDFRPLGTGVATAAFGDATAVRLQTANDSPSYLFERHQPQFARGLRVDGEGGSFFYLYATTNRQGCAVDVLSARVPIERAGERAAFQFWNGRRWTEDLEDAEAILKQVPGALGSVGWNQQLRRYLSAWSDLCTPGTQLLLRTAVAPEGPWSAPIHVDLGQLGASPEAYYGMWHPEFGRERDLLVSYFQPQAMLHGQVRLVRLKLPQ